MSIPIIAPCWRSFDQLEAFAKDADDPHLEPWRQFWRRVGKSGRNWIWHETDLVRSGEYEATYEDMPPKGLGKATRLVCVGESRVEFRRSRIRSSTR